MSLRTNEDWLNALKQPGEAQAEALEELRDYLFRAVLVYLHDHRSDLADYGAAEVRHLAEDLAQEALLSIRRNLDTFRGESRFTTWAYRFVINQAASELRLYHYTELSLDYLPDEESAALEAVIKDTASADPETAASQRQVVAVLLDIIQSELTERQRQAILGVHFQGSSMSQMAERLNISVNTLYKLMHDARQKIKAQLQARRLSENDIAGLFDE